MIKIPDRYKFTGTKSDGGMSSAYHCTDTHLEREVIIKELLNGIDKKRISEEISALLKVRSRYVVEIYDVVLDKSGEICGIVQEYLPGDDLTNLPIPKTELEFLKVVYPIASGLADIHSANVIHRDIKRNNVRFDAEGYLKIFDFGLAKSSLDASTMGELGTPGYMAPELFPSVADGKVDFTEAVDIYAFGALGLRLIRKFPAGFASSPPVLPCADADFVAFGFSPDIANCLNACIDPDPLKRPAASTVRNLIGQHLTKDMHRIRLILSGTPYLLDNTNRSAVLSSKNGSGATVEYDGLRITIRRDNGHVEVNNRLVSTQMCLPGSSVITLGAPELGTARDYVTVDISHPEPQV